MQIGVKLLETDKQVKKKILDGLKDKMRGVLRAAAVSIEPRIKNLVKFLITSSPTWVALETGQLIGEFGLTDPRGKLNEILDIWINSISVTTKSPRKLGDTLRGGLSIHLIQGDWSDVLASRAAKQTIEDGELPWLEWLLKFGDTVIVRDYNVSFTPNLRSRSGTAIMVRKTGAKWRVPPQFSGTIQANFITRALEGVDQDIAKITQKEIQKKL